MRVSPGRVLAVTVGLSVLGVLCGGILGGIAMLLDLRGHIRDAEVGGVLGAFSLGAGFGAIVGAVLAFATRPKRQSNTAAV